jgi:hypothetical protein
MGAIVARHDRFPLTHAAGDRYNGRMQLATFSISAIANADAERLRLAGGPTYVADAFPGFPCRHCLRDAQLGERVVLVSFDPFGADSPYRSASPIFLHADGCERFADDDDEIPTQLSGRQLSVRGFDGEAMMVDAAIVDGTDLEATVARLFTDPEISRIHVHNAVRGCWAATIERAR